MSFDRLAEFTDDPSMYGWSYRRDEIASLLASIRELPQGTVVLLSDDDVENMVHFSRNPQ